MADDLNRVFLWGLTRSMSTAVTKCLSYVDGIQIINQPYATAHYQGPEVQLPELTHAMAAKVSELLDMIDKRCAESDLSGIEDSVMTYKWIRDELLEVPYPNKKILLCRDQAPYLHGRYDMLPKGFKYSFLIRHPMKVFSSLKKYLTGIWGEFKDMRALPSLLFPPGCAFKELYDLVEYVRENIDPHPIIMDADDLLQDPAGILSTYCAKMGLPYSNKLLSWEPGSDITREWISSKCIRVEDDMMGFYKHAFESVGFDPPKPLPDPDSLPGDVLDCVKFSMEYYDSLCRDRITVKS